MSIFRVKKDKNYTCMSNHHLTNNKLSLNARGLFSYILYLPDSYKITIEGLHYSLGVGKTTIRSCINELIETGYIVRRQTRGTNGRFCEYEYDIYENPELAVRAEENAVKTADFNSTMAQAEEPMETAAESDFEDYNDFADYDEYDDADEYGEDFLYGEVEDDAEVDTYSYKMGVTDARIDALSSKIDFIKDKVDVFIDIQTDVNEKLAAANKCVMDKVIPLFEKLTSGAALSENLTHINTDNINTNKSLYNNPINQSNTVRTNSTGKTDGVDGYTNTSLPDMAVYEKYKAIIKDNISYDDFVISKKSYEMQEIDEIVDIMAQTVTFNTAPVSISGSLIPAEVVKSRLLKVTYSDIEYVLDCLSRTTTRIGNIRKYIIAAVYNARGSQNLYYGAAVRHDMYDGYGE